MLFFHGTTGRPALFPRSYRKTCSFSTELQEDLVFFHGATGRPALFPRSYRKA
jgi:hypothetical protein